MAQCAVRSAVATYSRDIRRNSSGGDDYPWDIMRGVADALDEILNYTGGAENALHDEYVMDRAKAAHAAAQSVPVAQASSEPEDGAEIVFLDHSGEQHRIVYDIREDHPGLGSGWFLHEDDAFQTNQPKLEGQNRILADRMWRTPEKRKQFETGTGLSDELTEEYQTRFIRWALAALSVPSASSPAQASGESVKVADLPRAVLDIANERFRQVEDEGWTPDHDDEHDEGALAQAALCYVYASVFDPGDFPLRYWPWDKEWWKPADNRRNLVKAAALIVAEIERLDRASPVPSAHHSTQIGD